jgi:hypothetical protein
MSSANIFLTVAATCGRAAPAIPTHAPPIVDGSIPAVEHAWPIASAKAVRVAASPTRTTLLGPPVPAPNTDFSSPITHDVVVPPPSMPRKSPIAQFYHPMKLACFGMCSTRNYSAPFLLQFNIAETFRPL